MNDDGFGQNPILCDPDVQLMLRVKAGDKAAFPQLVATYHDRTVDALTHLLRNQDLAQDAAQEVFLRIFKGRHSYEPTARFSAYIDQIVQELAVRRQGRAP